MNQKQGSWHLLTGVLIGLLAGLVFSLFVVPVRYTDTDPSSLSQEGREIYRGVVARAFLVEGDTPRALSRLALLKDVNPVNAVVEQAQGLLGEGGDETMARSLALLAAAQSQPSTRITALPRINAQVSTASVPTITATAPTSEVQATKTPRATVTPRPTFAPSPTPGAPYALMDRKEVCNQQLTEGLLQVFINDVDGNGVAGIKIEVSLPGGGTESFFTGFYPEIDAGYADYRMIVGMTYNLRVSGTSDLVMNLSIPDCETAGGNHYPGVIRLVFQQP